MRHAVYTAVFSDGERYSITRDGKYSWHLAMGFKGSNPSAFQSLGELKLEVEKGDGKVERRYLS